MKKENIYIFIFWLQNNVWLMKLINLIKKIKKEHYIKMKLQWNVIRYIKYLKSYFKLLDKSNYTF